MTAVTSSPGSLRSIRQRVRAYARDTIRGHALIAGGDGREIALTFDDGPNDPYTFQLLELLERFRVRGTFFLIGGFVRRRPDIVRSIVQGGHLVGNHTLTHPALMWRRPKQVREELLACSQAIEDAAGIRVQYFRPPFGVRWRHVIEVANDLGMTSVMWNVTGYDWESDPAEAIVSRVLSGVEQNFQQGNGSNILLHDGNHTSFGANRSATVLAVAQVMEALCAKRLRFVTVDQFTN